MVPEPTAINYPIIGKLIIDAQEIKRVNLEYNVKNINKK